MRPYIVPLLLSIANPVFACVCDDATDEEEYKASKSVVLVRITDSQFVRSTKEREFDWVRANFEVIKTYKGDSSGLRYLRSEKVVCEVPLIPGDLYLVFSRGAEYETLNRCTRSRWVNPHRVDEIEREFGE